MPKKQTQTKQDKRKQILKIKQVLSNKAKTEKDTIVPRK